MTRAAFAEATGLGEASLSRWENGAVIQNKAYDYYLRLLRWPWVMSALQHFMVTEPERPEETSVGGTRFRVLVVSESVLSRQAKFQLRLAG